MKILCEKIMQNDVNNTAKNKEKATRNELENAKKHLMRILPRVK